MERSERPDAERDFHLAEFNKLNGEIAELIKSATQLFVFAAGSSGAIFAWLLTVEGVAANLRMTGMLIPAMLTCVLAVMAYAQGERIRQMGQYLRRLEDEYGRTDFGWEKQFQKEGAAVGIATIGAWIILLVCDIVAALLIARG